MSLPNLLTISRLGFALLIAMMLLSNSLLGNIAATILFVLAALTDLCDGYLARKRGLVTDFGKIMDPIADKILILSIFAVLAHLGLVRWWMVTAIAVREIAVTISRLRAMGKGEVLAAEHAGKIKTVLQMAAITAILLFLIFERSSGASSWFYKVEAGWQSLINVLMVATVIVTIGSGSVYFINRWKNQPSQPR